MTVRERGAAPCSKTRLDLFADLAEDRRIVAAVIDHDIGTNAARFGQPAADGEVEQRGIERQVAGDGATGLSADRVALGDRDPGAATGTVEQF